MAEVITAKGRELWIHRAACILASRDGSLQDNPSAPFVDYATRLAVFFYDDEPGLTKPEEAVQAEAAALMEIARGQRALHRLSQFWLRQDKYDGARFVRLMEMHGKLFRKAKDELRELALIDDKAIREANRIAGDPEGVD